MHSSTLPDLPIHPTTGLRALGFTSRGPIWPVAGAAPTPEEEAAAATAAAEAAAAAAATAAADAAVADGDGTDDDDDEPLGPKGQKALDAEKDKRKQATAARRTAEQALADAQTEIARLKAGGGASDEAEQARQQITTDAQKTADARANARILKSEVKRLATGKLANPAIALQLLDLSAFEVNDDGDVDEDEINDAIATLITKEPYLAAQGRRFGDVDAGPRNGGPGAKGAKPPQVTEAQLATMSPEEIVTAQKEGRLANLLGG